MSKLAERLRNARKSIGYSQKNLAKMVGLTQQSYQDMEAGRTKRPRSIERIASALKVTPEYLLFGTINVKHVCFVPRLDWSEIPVPPNLDIISEKEGIIPMPCLEDELLYALKINGDSMISQGGIESFADGEIIILSPLKTPKHGDFVVVIQPNASQAIFKQYLVDGSNIYLSSLNPRYPTIPFTSDSKICGVLVAKYKTY